MSVINNMLRDLDQRQGRAPGEASAGETVRAVPAPRSPWHIGRAARAWIALILAGGALGAGWQLQRQAAPAASPDTLMAAAPPSPRRPAAELAVLAPAAAVQPAPALMTAAAATPVMPPAPVPVAVAPAPPQPDEARSPAAKAAPVVEVSAPKPVQPVAQAPKSLRAPVPPVKLAQASVPAVAAATPVAAVSPAAIAAPSMAIARGEPGSALVARTAGPAARSEGKTYNPRQAAAKLVADAQQLERQGRQEEARTLLLRALAAHPAELTARHMLVQGHLDAGQLDDAQALLSEGLRLHPDQPALTQTLARLKVEKGDVAGAIQLLETARGPAADDAATHALLGALLLRVQRYDESARHYLSALRADPGNSSWLVGAGVALEAIGKTADAAEAYRRASTAPGLTPALSAFLGERLARLGGGSPATRAAARP
jgi:MSHA biogenesis protein MshN